MTTIFDLVVRSFGLAAAAIVVCELFRSPSRTRVLSFPEGMREYRGDLVRSDNITAQPVALKCISTGHNTFKVLCQVEDRVVWARLTVTEGIRSGGISRTWSVAYDVELSQPLYNELTSVMQVIVDKFISRACHLRSLGFFPLSSESQ